MFTLKRRKSFLVTGFATLILLGLFTVGGFAASNTVEQKHDMGAMTNAPQSGHDMGSMTDSSQNGHNMNAMTNNSQNGNAMGSMPNDSQNGHGMKGMNGMDHKKEAVPNDNPWPILYGFGGFIFGVIIIAGIKKFTGVKGKGVN